MPITATRGLFSHPQLQHLSHLTDMFALRFGLSTYSHPFSRLLCTSVPPPQSELTTRISALPASLLPSARRLLTAISDARDAATGAHAEGSDDDERLEAVLKAKYALSLYVDLVAKGDPPIRLSPHASHVLDDDTYQNEQQGDIVKNDGRAKSLVGNVLEPRNDVMRALGEEVHQMKDDVFLANRQRIWLGWHGWF